MKAVKVKITNIHWVIEDEGGETVNDVDYDHIREKLGLPEEDEVEFDDESGDLDELCIDYLADRYGFLVNSFNIEVIKGDANE